ncbi:MAG TPA: 2-oxo acid dehydrogenase subunit E2 [Caulobacteraceae bacterium]|nr:2-oxo acid dehydrogenase subunit E2 [Caulobacteraceae bacterium]
MTALSDITAPLEQEGTKSVVRNWLKKIGDPVRVNDPIVELETDKVSVEVAADSEGVLAEILLEPGSEAGPGAVLGRLKTGSAKASQAEIEQAPTEGPAVTPAGWSSEGERRSIAEFDPELRLSPSVRRFCLEHGLDPSGLTGTGRGGRLTRQDVEAALSGRSAAPAKVEPKPKAATPQSEAGVTRIPHDSMRRRIAEHMSLSVATAPHVTAVFEADFSAIMAHRKAHKAEMERRGASLTYTAYIVAAAVEAMKVAPTVNSRWHDDFLEVFSDVNVGVGTALGDKGLVVPVIRRAQDLSLFGVAQALHELTEKARNGKLAPADVRDGTFSISNHGVSGSLVATPIIINQPQSAILGVGKLEKRVVVREVGGADAIQVRPMAYVSLTIDHRVLDGAQTNAWLTRFVEVLEAWA